MVWVRKVQGYPAEDSDYHYSEYKEEVIRYSVYRFLAGMVVHRVFSQAFLIVEKRLVLSCDSL
jgi:hypothetical protein